ncbi:MAG: glycosyltransferase [Pseudomonadota bacterium]
MDESQKLKICLLSYRSNPHCGGQGVYLKNLSRALKDLGHHVEVVSGPPDPLLDKDIPVHHIPCLDLYNEKRPLQSSVFKRAFEPCKSLRVAGSFYHGFP